ncbi:ribonuclease H-like domain-containing protein [Tanacetum coccineum]
MAEQDIPLLTITAIKIPIIRKEEYDIWSMRMRQYICHTDHNLWDVIVNGDLVEEPTLTGETSAPPAPKTAKQLATRRNRERVKSILLLAIPDEYLLKFHNVDDARSLWEAIKSRFGGNEESKKMQKNVLKHQFENFSTASNESLDKSYDRFQKLISQLEVHGAPISKEDINQKFLRSLPPSWNQIALITRNKPDIDEIDIDDLYNTLRVYEDEMKRSSSSTSTSQNLAFLSSENTSSTNEVSTTSGDFEIDQDDLEELDLRWQVAMLTVRVRKFIQNTGRNMDFKEKRHVSLDKSKMECYNCHRKGHFARECRSGRNQWKRSYGDNSRSNAPTNESSSQALVARCEISLSVFDVRYSDEESTPANDRSSKADGYHAVPPPITRNFLTPRADISFVGLDEYATRKKIIESKTTDLNTKTSGTVGVQNFTTAGTRAVVNTGKGKMDIDLKKSRWVWRPKGNYLDHVSKDSESFMLKKGNLEILLQDHAVVDSGCSSHMTGNKAYLSNYKDFNRGFVAFGSDPKGGKNNGFKLLDESQVVLRAPRKDDVYSLDLKNIVRKSKLNHNVKIIRCDNGTEFKNHAMNELCAKKGIKREFSMARTPQQNGVAERKNRTLIEAARTMLADSLLPIPFWAKAVNTACYVLNRVLVTKPQNKTPYELLIGKSPSISFMRPFGCPLTILNTLDSLGKFDGKSDEGYLLGYSTTSKAFRVYNKRTKRVEENLHIDFLEDQPNVAGTGPNWMFDLDFLTNLMNYIPTRILVEDVALAAHEKPSESSPKDNDVQDSEDVVDKEGQHQMTKDEQVLHDELEKMIAQESASTPTGANASESSFVYIGGKIPINASTLPNADLPIDPNMPDLEDDSDAFLSDGIFNGAYDDENVGAVADFNNMDETINVSPIPTLRIHKNHPKDQIIGDPKSAVQTRGKI